MTFGGPVFGALACGRRKMERGQFAVTHRDQILESADRRAALISQNLNQFLLQAVEKWLQLLRVTHLR